MNIKNITSKFSKFSKREKMLSLAGGAVLLFLFADLLVARPLGNYYISLKERTAVEEKKLEQNMVNITRKDMIEKRFEEYKGFIRTPAGDEEEAATMLSEIERLARSNEVFIGNMTPKEVKAQEFYKEYTVELDAETEVKQMAKFIHEMEASSQLMRVVKAKFNLKEKGSQIVKAKLTVTKAVML